MTEVWAWDNGCTRAVQTTFVKMNRGSYECLGELFDNAAPYDGGSDKVSEIKERLNKRADKLLETFCKEMRIPLWIMK